MVRYPLLMVAALFAAGIALGDAIPACAYGSGGLSICLLAGFALVRGKGRTSSREDANATCSQAAGNFGRPDLVSSGFLAAAILTCGFTSQRFVLETVPPDDVRHVSPAAPALVRLRGTLLEKPHLRAFENARHERKIRSQSRLRVVAILHAGTEWRPASGIVLVTTPFEHGPEYHTGAPVEVFGLLEVPPGPQAPGLFDYRSYLARGGIHRRLKTQSLEDWRRTQRFDPGEVPWPDRFEDWARLTLARGVPVEDDGLRLSWAMALGWKTAFTDEVSDPFMKTGTMHLFAISGLHVVLISGIFVQLLKGMRVPRAWSGWAIIPLLWAYTAATGWQASALRASVMMTLVLASWSLRRPVDLLNSLGAAALAILAFDPQQLFQAGFQLSFLVVFSLAVLTPRLGGWHSKLRWVDPWVPERLIPPWRFKLEAALRWVDQALATSLAAWLGSVTLTAEYFHLIAPSGLLANVIVVPIGNLALMCQLGSLLCGHGLAELGELFNLSGWFWMHVMIRICETMADWPGSHAYVHAPGAAACLLALAAMAALLLESPNRWRLLVWSGLPVAVAMSLWMERWHRSQRETRLTVLNLPLSRSLFVDLRGSQDDVVLDTGADDDTKRVLTPFLHSLGKNSLPLVIITQGDLAHAGGLQRFLDHFDPPAGMVPDQRFRSPAHRAAMAAMEERKMRLDRIQRGDQFGAWEVLHPVPQERPRQGDDAAAVLRLEAEGVRVLFCGSLGESARKSLLHAPHSILADVLLCAIPARDDPLDEETLRSISPRHVLITERENQLRRSAILKQRLNRLGIPWHSTFESGTLQVRLQSGSFEVISSK